ncbi:MAG: DUF1835 domain-containing protein [Pseudomonadota bacterium]
MSRHDQPHSQEPADDGIPDLEHQKKRAKDLFKALRAGNVVERKRLTAVLPKTADVAAADLKLSDAQQVIGRENGFAGWPQMKSYIDKMAITRQSIANGSLAIPDDDRTLHIRCGTDIRHALQIAGFQGNFHEFSDPFCQGPIPDAPLPVLMQTRADFISAAFGIPPAEAMDRQQRAYAGLMQAGDYARVVLWFEHDSFDQLILAFLLDFFGALHLPARLELICVDKVPGVADFVGLGQLSPEMLRKLWDNARGQVTDAHYDLGKKVWRAIRASDPAELATIAKSDTRPVRLMARALERHLAELPAIENDLGLTQKLVLEILDEAGPFPASRVFGRLMRGKEPLPFLGDMMFWHLLDDLANTTVPLIDGAQDSGVAWPDRILTLTDTGKQVLGGQKRFFEFYQGTRWVGGVKITADAPCPHWDATRRKIA